MLQEPRYDYKALPQAVYQEVIRHGITDALAKQLAPRVHRLVEFAVWQRKEMTNTNHFVYAALKDNGLKMHRQCMDVFWGSEWKGIAFCQEGGNYSILKKLEVVREAALTYEKLYQAFNPKSKINNMTADEAPQELKHTAECLEEFKKVFEGTGLNEDFGIAGTLQENEPSAFQKNAHCQSLQLYEGLEEIYEKFNLICPWKRPGSALTPSRCEVQFVVPQGVPVRDRSSPPDPIGPGFITKEQDKVIAFSAHRLSPVSSKGGSLHQPSTLTPLFSSEHGKARPLEGSSKPPAAQVHNKRRHPDGCAGAYPPSPPVAERLTPPDFPLARDDKHPQLVEPEIVVAEGPPAPSTLITLTEDYPNLSEGLALVMLLFAAIAGIVTLNTIRAF